MEQARQLYTNGQELYEEGAYDAAILAFQESYRLSGRHALLFNIGNAYERLGDLEAALDAFNQYRAFAPPEEREALSRRVSAIERRMEEEAAAAPAPEPVVGPVAVATLPAATPEMASLPQPSEPPARSPGRVLAPVGIAVAAVAGTVAAVTYTQSRSWRDEGDQAAWDRWRPINNASVVLAGTGAVVGVAGLVWPKKKQASAQGGEQ